jgi:hypothetical protein
MERSDGTSTRSVDYCVAYVNDIRAVLVLALYEEDVVCHVPLFLGLYKDVLEDGESNQYLWIYPIEKVIVHQFGYNCRTY